MVEMLQITLDGLLDGAAYVRAAPALLAAMCLAFLAGRIPKKLYATASSPMEGRIQ